MENEDSDGDGTVNGGVGYGEVIVKEALRNGSINKNPEKRGNRGEPSKDRNVRDDHKRTRTRNPFAINTNLVGRENTGHFAKDCRVVPRNVNLINARNPTVRACYECGSTDHVKSACPMLNQAQRPGVNPQNQVMAINGGQGHGMDWLSDHKAEIICHEKIVRTPLLDGKVLRVLGEKPKEKTRQLMSAKTKCWELNTSELVLPRDELVLLSQQLVLLEENSSYCSRLQLSVLNQSVNTVRIIAVGKKVNAAESLLVVSTKVNAN
ncbi:putative reverse transcriptase domain-containing protein [Tanacetum coccineum]